MFGRSESDKNIKISSSELTWHKDRRLFVLKFQIIDYKATAYVFWTIKYINCSTSKKPNTWYNSSVIISFIFDKSVNSTLLHVISLVWNFYFFLNVNRLRKCMYSVQFTKNTTSGDVKQKRLNISFILKQNTTWFVVCFQTLDINFIYYQLCFA